MISVGRYIPQVARCADCQTTATIYGRGLCSLCYDRHERQGDLTGYPTNAEIIRIDWAFLRAVALLSVEDAAVRLNLAYRSGLSLDREIRANPRTDLV